MGKARLSFDGELTVNVDLREQAGRIEKAVFDKVSRLEKKMVAQVESNIRSMVQANFERNMEQRIGTLVSQTMKVEIQRLFQSTEMLEFMIGVVKERRDQAAKEVELHG